MSGICLEQSWTAKFNDWQKQCMYKAFGYSADILACTPESLPLIFDAPSYPLQSFKSRPNQQITSLMIFVSISALCFLFHRGQQTPHAPPEH